MSHLLYSLNGENSKSVATTIAVLWKMSESVDCAESMIRNGFVSKLSETLQQAALSNSSLETLTIFMVLKYTEILLLEVVFMVLITLFLMEQILTIIILSQIINVKKYLILVYQDLYTK